MNVIWVVVSAWLIYASEVKCEADYDFGLHHSRPIVVHGSPVSLPSFGIRHHHHHDPSSKIVQSYSSGFEEYGSGPVQSAPPPPPPPLKQQFRLPHPNALPPSESSKEGYEVVAAPVIYHQTVTDKDSDVSQALADAFGVVQNLRKPGPRKYPGKAQPVRTFTNVEFVDHAFPQQYKYSKPSTVTTTTTTIVEEPHRVLSQVAPIPIVTSTLPVVAQQVTHGLPPVPAAADIPPAPIPVPVVATSTPPIISSAIPVAPSPLPVRLVTKSQSSPKFIIPSQPHVTTLKEAVQSGNPEVRTIIQPIYIPFQVDQNGQPIGPLPDYHTMDFTALLSAQKQLLTAGAVPTVAATAPQPTLQIVETQTVQVQQQPQIAQHYVIQQQDQPIVAASSIVPESSSSAAAFGARIPRQDAERLI